MFNPWLIIGVIVSLGIAGVGGYFKGSHDKQAEWDIALLKANNAAQAKKIEADAEAARITDTLKSQVTTAENNYNDAIKKIDGLRIANGRLQRATCGMFDKNGRKVLDSGMPEGPASAPGSAGTLIGCLLPGQAYDDLVGLAADADRDRERFRLARQTALEMCVKLGSPEDSRECSRAIAK